ncbi:MAG: hypothetical protein DRJ31_10435 [Candidatus Methanomethylicota archaeon]|uniref:histidine kinase n=1 Tax=Thermoproteota archaeon TaxID=2056631 RepID=A0A497EKH4_9CREN|nr:MAG: hypothetical protein DRJ31_10435 [Candidatus Verstraetearchaeota archaeon]
MEALKVSPQRRKNKQPMSVEIRQLRQRIAELEASEREYKRASEIDKHLIEQLQTLIETAPVIICRSDLKTKITYVNKRFEEVTGYAREEVMGKSWAKLGAISRENARSLINRGVGKSKGSPPAPMEVQFKCKDGRLIWVTGIGEIIREKGKPVGFQIVAQDITEQKLTQQRIENAAKEWRATFDAILDLVSIHDKNFNIIRANKALASAFQMEPKDVLGHTCYELIHGSKEPRPDCPFRQTLKTGKPAKREFFEPHLGIYAEVCCSPIFNSEGEVTTAIHVIRDITDRKRAEEDIRKFKVLADNAVYGVSISDLKGKLIYVNEAYAKMHGYTVDELIGSNRFRLYPENQHELMKRRMKQLRQTGSVAGELLRMRKDGTIFPSFSTATLVEDDHGRPLYIASSHFDLTEIKQTEQALRESEEMYRALLELGERTGEAVVMLQDDERGVGMHVFVSDEWSRITGYSKEELLNMSMADLIHPRDRKAAVERHMRRMRGEVLPGLYEVTIVRKDGTEVPVEVTYAYTTYKGKYANVGYIRDITNRKKMEEQLIVTDRLASIGELASGVAHELNNPLTGIIGFSELLLKKDIPEDIKEDLKIINREARRTAQIVGNLLTFARKHPEEKQPVDINKVIQTILDLRAYEQKVNNIEVKTQFATDLPEIVANAFQIQQVFLNIIINAEHFMTEAHKRGTLTITTERVGDVVRVSIADDGPGIAKENLNHIFDPFFTTKEVGKGTGLGLSISHGIITENGGRIYAESEPGKGSTFIVELPIRKTEGNK